MLNILQLSRLDGKNVERKDRVTEYEFLGFRAAKEEWNNVKRKKGVNLRGEFLLLENLKLTRSKRILCHGISFLLQTASSTFTLRSGNLFATFFRIR